MIVVEDSADVLALWCPKGTVRKVPITPASIPAGMSRGEWLAQALTRRDWPLEDAAWDVSSLMLHREGDWHAVWLSFLESGEQWGWYVNFQEPYRRTERGIQTMDLALDIIAEPDRSSLAVEGRGRVRAADRARRDQRRGRSAGARGGRDGDRQDRARRAAVRQRLAAVEAGSDVGAARASRRLGDPLTISR